MTLLGTNRLTTIGTFIFICELKKAKSFDLFDKNYLKNVLHSIANERLESLGKNGYL